MQINNNIKDWEIARDIFGKNTQKECKIIKSLRKGIVDFEEICEGWYIVRTKQHVEKDEVGWLISANYLE